MLNKEKPFEILKKHKLSLSSRLIKLLILTIDHFLIEK